MTHNQRNIAFIGAGNMNHSIISGLIKSGYPVEKIFVSNPSSEKLQQLSNQFGVNISNSNSDIVSQCEVAILGVKPQIMQTMAEQLRNEIDLSNKLFISIAAGLPISRLQQMLGGDYPIIRTMPNTPSLLGLGMTGLYAPASINEQDKQFAEGILAAVGKTLWVEREADIDAIIAAAGSSPAYFFLFMEAMQKEAVNMGFNEQQARELVQQAAIGSASMVLANPETSLQSLRQQVTSKGGTTAEAIATFEQADLSGTVAKAMQAAVNRAQELAKQL